MSIDPAWLSNQFPQLTTIALLASGGQKTVFTARHPIDGDVVLKIIKPGGDPRRTDRELLAVQNVQCTRVPQIVEQGVISTPVGDCVWLREQRVMGTTVRHSLQAGSFQRPNL